MIDPSGACAISGYYLAPPRRVPPPSPTRLVRISDSRGYFPTLFDLDGGGYGGQGGC